MTRSHLLDRLIGDRRPDLSTDALLREFEATPYDDRIAARYGGQTMQELLEESVVEHFRSAHGRDHFKA